MMNVFQNYNAMLLLLLSLFGISATAVAAAAVADMTDEMQAQWKLWPYLDESICWNSDWTRWYGTNTSVKEHFQAYRCFEAPGNYSTIQSNTYFYEDGRGEVSINKDNCQSPPVCGPWLLDKTDPQTSSPYGVVHPSRAYMRTIMFPDRSAAWIMKDLPRVPVCSSPRGPVPCAGFELFLGDGKFLRLSIGLVYDDRGQLSQVSAIREDSRDFGLFWSYTKNDTTTTTDTTATATGEFLPLLTKYTDRNEKETVLNNFWSNTNGSENDGTTTVSTVLVPGLEYIQQIDQGSSTTTNRFSNNMAEHEVFEIMTDGILVVCPSHLPSVENDDDGTFQIAAGWKKDDDGSFVSSIEALYTNFTMSELVYTTFRKKKNSSKSEKSKRKKHSKKHTKKTK